MTTCKILVVWNFTNESGNSPVFADGSNLFTTLFDTNNNGVVDNNNNWGFNDYISQGECANFSGSDDFKNKSKNSCNTEYRRPLDNTKWYKSDSDGLKRLYDSGKDADYTSKDCKNDDYGSYACLDIQNISAPIFETGSTFITPSGSLTWAISTDDLSWDDGLWEDARKYNLVADYKVDNINKLYVSEKKEDPDNNTTFFKIDISKDKTLLYNTPWKFLLNPTEDNSDLTDIFEKIQFWVALDNDTQSKYILEPDCWGPDEPCENQTTNGDSSSGDSSSGDSSSGDSSSSNSLAIILIASIGGFLLLILIIVIIFLLLPGKSQSPSVQ